MPFLVIWRNDKGRKRVADSKKIEIHIQSLKTAFLVDAVHSGTPSHTQYLPNYLYSPPLKVHVIPLCFQKRPTLVPFSPIDRNMKRILLLQPSENYIQSLFSTAKYKKHCEMLPLLRNCLIQAVYLSYHLLLLNISLGFI